MKKQTLVEHDHSDWQLHCKLRTQRTTVFCKIKDHLLDMCGRLIITLNHQDPGVLAWQENEA